MIDSLPATIPGRSAALLPANYEAAKNAISECERIDECQNWANKAAAIESYARMSNDESLQVLALRIRARAERRCGELLKEIPLAHGINQNIKAGGHPKVTRTLAATDAGLSESARKRVLRIASVPRGEFEQQMERARPPTVTQLAERGRIARANAAVSPGEVNCETPKGYEGLVQFVRFCGQNEPSILARGCNPSEAAALRQCVAKADRWLERFVENLSLSDGT